MQLSGGSTKKPQDRTIIVDLGSGDPARLRITAAKDLQEGKNQGPFAKKNAGNQRTTKVEGWNGKRIRYSLAGLPYLENWGNLKGIVLNLHRSLPPQSAATLCSFLKYALHNSLSALVCLAVVHMRVEQQSIGFSGTLHTPIFYVCPPETESLFKQMEPWQKLSGPDVCPITTRCTQERR